MKIRVDFTLDEQDRRDVAAFYRYYRVEEIGDEADRPQCVAFIRRAVAHALLDGRAARRDHQHREERGS